MFNFFDPNPKIFLGSMPPDSLEPSLFLNQFQISSAEKNGESGNCGLPLKISRFATDLILGFYMSARICIMDNDLA